MTTTGDPEPVLLRAVPDEVTCDVRYEPPMVVVRVRGVLTIASAPRVREVALKCLADTPSAVVFDVAGLTLGDELAVTVFAVVARHAAAWPAIPVLLCGPQPVFARWLSRLGIDRQVPVVPGFALARAAAEHHTEPARVFDHLPPVRESVPVARNLVADACRRWSLPHLADTAGLVATELAANAVRHARTAMDVIATRGRRHLHLAVRDHSRRPPRLVGPDGEAEPGGRGLLVVDNLADHWGYTPAGDGKVTWATLRLAGLGRH